MSYLINWVSEIVLIVLFAVILELLVPSGVFQKYIKFVIGLVLIVALMDPVIRLFQVDPSSLLQGLKSEQNDSSIKSETARQKNEIQKAQAAYIQEQVAVRMKNQVKEELNEKYGLQITDIALSGQKVVGQELSLGKVTVTIGKSEQNHRSQESGIRTIQPVKNVSIDLGKNESEKNKVHESNEVKSVRSFLAKRWELSQSLIKVNREGGKKSP
ncbi:MAG: stage III sporulation protein AF [Sporolactobacillus sp.]